MHEWIRGSDREISQERDRLRPGNPPKMYTVPLGGQGQYETRAQWDGIFSLQTDDIEAVKRADAIVRGNVVCP